MLIEELDKLSDEHGHYKVDDFLKKRTRVYNFLEVPAVGNPKISDIPK